MRVLLTTLALLAVFASLALADDLRIIDTLTLSSKADKLFGHPDGSSTMLTARTLTSPGPEGGSWKVSYDRMSLNDVSISGAQGRSYSVTVSDGSLKIQPIAPTDSVGLSGVAEDMETLRPFFEGTALCQQDEEKLCPSLGNLLRRFGEPRLKERKEGMIWVEVTTSLGERLEGVVRLEPERWTVDLDGLRRETIHFEANGDRKEVTADLSAHYHFVREFQK
jgi:hypothetical protein